MGNTAAWSRPTAEVKEQTRRPPATKIVLAGYLDQDPQIRPSKTEGEEYALTRIKVIEPAVVINGREVKPEKTAGHSILVNNSALEALKGLKVGDEMTAIGYLKDDGRGEASIGIYKVSPGIDHESPLNVATVRGEILKTKIVGKDGFRNVELEIETPGNDQRFFAKIYAKADCEKVAEEFARGKFVEAEGKFVSTGTKEQGYSQSISVNNIREVERDQDLDAGAKTGIEDEVEI